MSEAAVPQFSSFHVRRRAALERTRRFALVGTVAGAVLLFLATGATFTASNDTLTLTTISATGSPAVYAGSSIPAGTVNSILPPGGWVTGTKTPPSWVPALNTVSANTSATGDIAMVDTRSMISGTVIVTVALGNAAALNADYSYLILPLQLRACTGGVTNCAWGGSAANDSSSESTARYLSLTNGFQQYFMPAGALYEVVVPAGGSIYTINTTVDSTHALAPTFVVTVQPA